MDWFTWLSRTDLEPSLVHEYGLSFSQNELEHGDIAYFNHEFLQSMGISIAKHRLKILRLARQHRKNSPHPLRSIPRAVAAIKKTGKSFSDHVRAWIRRHESSSSLALVLVSEKKTSRRSGFGKWKEGFLKRNKRSHVMPSNGNGGYGGGFEKQERLLLTNGTTPCRFDSFKEEDHYKDETFLEDIKWDSMFQNLKPT